MITSYTIVTICYVSMAIKLNRKQVTTSGGENKYRRSTQMMMVFITAYFVQFWAVTVFAIWNMFTEPPLGLYLMVVTCSNVGGLLNLMAYTLIRKRFLSRISDA